MAKIVISGGSGFLGRKLIQTLLQQQHELIVLTRSIVDKNKQDTPHLHYKTWNPLSDDKTWTQWIDGADAVIHLAGAPASKRWTKKHKQAIMESRSVITRYLSDSINASINPPKFFFSASGIGYYGDAGDKICTENSSPSGSNDFLSDVCKEWEKSAMLANGKTRLVIGRIGIILDKNEGALAKMLPTFRFGIGGSLGTGNQWWSWIHYADVVGMIVWAMGNENIRGVVNIVSPNPVRMQTFAKILAGTLRRPAFLSVPQFLLSIVMGENAAMVTNSQRVMPVIAQQNGYEFRFPILEQSLSNILKD